MPIEWAERMVLLSTLYVGTGLLVAPVSIFLGLKRIDQGAAVSPMSFRWMILPGSILLWPVILKRIWAGKGQAPAESNAHRRMSRISDGESGASAGGSAPEIDSQKGRE